MDVVSAILRTSLPLVVIVSLQEEGWGRRSGGSPVRVPMFLLLLVWLSAPLAVDLGLYRWFRLGVLVFTMASLPVFFSRVKAVSVWGLGLWTGLVLWEYFTDHPVTVVSLLNSEFVARMLLIAGSVLLLLLFHHYLRLLKGSVPGLLSSLLVGGGLLVLEIVLAGEVVLELVRSDVLPPSRGLVGFSARTTRYAPLSGYLFLAVCAVMVGYVALVHRPRHAAAEPEETGPERRKRCAAARRHRRRTAAGVVVVLMVAFPLLFQDIWGGRAPRLSAAEEVALSPASGSVEIPLEEVSDGNLHRYAFLSTEGTAVRFFVINRDPSGMDPVAVLDACMLCGDAGYVQEGEDVICVACGVKMFIPTIGEPGGCNPIPIDYTVTRDMVMIGGDVLENAAVYFLQEESF
ncbi:Fe-S-containing protein [Spirochaeta thermophila]|uniref:Putative membrane protein n=1 Tax=Winmispira thermophila (strain ATCC 49972 / DSM 6192 / RI 19.B1) TaxID=665571 RepID=E0RPG9_WINT6|nr:Fe-S-containing protein [Spirochaeta thermophila]ADN02751.1 putative membrane protein [Spirochaeta thermophila DSM 6192]